MPDRPVKKVSESSLDNQQYMIFPDDLNPNGTVFGGTVMAEGDKIAALVARRHSEQNCVTACVDSCRFLAPGRQGEVLVFNASVNRVWNSSMEIGVKVFSENYKTGEKRHIVSAYYTFVPINEQERPVPVKYGLQPETEDAKRRYRQAESRRQRRLAEREQN